MKLIYLPMNISDHKQEFEQIIDHMKEQLTSIRSNRATPALVEQIPIDVYGSRTPLQQLASISIPEPKQILVEPWDKSITKEIEKSISNAKTGLSMLNEGNLIRLTLAPMTEESRKEIVKALHQRIEQGRVQIRRIRDKVKDEIVKGESSGEITEDDKYRLIDELDKTTREYTDTIDKMGKEKEEEILKI